MAQSHWEDIDITIIAEITTDPQKDHHNYDLRPYVKDKTTNTWLLVDSGATCTILPATSCKDPVLNPSVKLQAVNETQLDTFGTQLVKNHIGDSVYTHCQNHHCQHKNSYFGLGLSDCPPF